MKLAPAALLLILAAAVPFLAQAQAFTPTPFQPPRLQTRFTDPANLGRERVAPRNGHELPLDRGALGLQQLLRKLNTRASILNIVAHPDDEDGGMMALYSRGLGARVADISLTRGEGGQNAATGDFEDALGLLRTQELLANDRYTGVTQMFGTEVDFGFSKTKQESFAKWNHQRVLYDVVRAIRIYRPLVLTSTWIGGVTDGHGQHQVSGEIAQEAFVAAGDPTVFPSLTAEGILPWQPLKMYARVPSRAISPKGLFDYATTQYIAPRFTNYITGQVTTTIPATDVVIHEGDPDPLLTVAAANRADLPPALAAEAPGTPLSYIQFARIGLGLQKSQIGPGFRNARPGAFDVPYHLYGSRLCDAPASTRPPTTTPPQTSMPPTNGPSQNCHPERSEGPASPPVAALAPATRSNPNFFTGIDTSLNGILSLDKNAPLSVAAWAHITQSIAEAQRRFDPRHPETIAPLLADALANMDLEIDLLHKNERPSIARASILHELRIKRVQLNDAVALALGLSTDASSQHADLVQNSATVAHTTAAEIPNTPPAFPMVTSTSGGTIRSDIQSNSSYDPHHPSPVALDLTLPPLMLATVTKPYFYRDNIEQPVYELRDAALRSAPATPAPLVEWTTYRYVGTTVQVGHIVHSGPQPVSIIPAVSIAAAPSATVLPTAQPTAELTATIHTATSTPVNINVQSPPGWRIDAQLATHLPAVPAAQASSVAFQLHPTATFTQPQLFHVSAETPDHHTYTEGFRPVGYGDLPRTNYYTPATDRIVPVDLNLPAPNHRRIAYLPGTGDAVPEALASIGLAPTILTVADLTPGKLKAFDTVILGVRTYNAHPDLHGAPTQALLEFAKNGGNVVVQYQTDEFTAADAPYPLSLGADEKVVDETTPVELLQPANPLLSVPNKITPADFNGWIEERGHGFMSTWDPHYTALTETHDPGAPSERIAPQLPQLGGLLTTQLGRGRWTYCAFALYRQLPEAVPGAFRLFVNLLNP